MREDFDPDFAFVIFLDQASSCNGVKRVLKQLAHKHRFARVKCVGKQLDQATEVDRKLVRRHNWRHIKTYPSEREQTSGVVEAGMSGKSLICIPTAGLNAQRLGARFSGDWSSQVKRFRGSKSDYHSRSAAAAGVLRYVLFRGSQNGAALPPDNLIKCSRAFAIRLPIPLPDDRVVGRHFPFSSVALDCYRVLALRF